MLVVLTRTVEFLINATYMGVVPVAVHDSTLRPANVCTTVPRTGIVMFGKAD